MQKLIFYVSLVITTVNSEIFSAIEELEKQLVNNRLLIDELEKFTLTVDDEYVHKKINTWKNENSIAEVEILRYITNPLNAFMIINRAVNDVKLMQSRFPKESEKFMQKIINLQPTDADLHGAVEGLLRLQFFYKLKTIDFANGIIDGQQTRSPLSVFDLFVIGEKAIQIGQHYFALEYLQIAYDKLHQGLDVDNEVNEKILIMYLFSINKTVRHYENAREMLKELTLKFPELPGDNYYSFLNHSLHADRKKFGSNNPVFDDRFSDNFVRDGIFSDSKDRILNSQICRGNISKSTEEISKLRCRYVSTNPFSILARFKIEEANLHPYIVLFIDVVSDDELMILKEASKVKQGPGTITKSNLEQKVSSSRIAQISWHYENEHEIFRKLSRRVEDMTGLSQVTAEPLQTQNYGIGGHYVGHWDCFMKWDKAFESDGNRIATVLFYLSDVEKGGGTAFPFLKLHVSPRKGAAIFWYNLSSSGSCDFLTRHSACPVLLGSKWVANKWIREYGNEFRRSCVIGEIYKTEEMEKNLFKIFY